jgi:tetratricopeptide (TPR) repeat protein
MNAARAVLLLLAAGASLTGHAEIPPVLPLLREAEAAEARLDSARALELYLQIETARPTDARVLRKIARQYSDLAVDLPDPARQKATVQQALAYARRAVELEPQNAENVLSVAVCLGKLAVLGTTREKVAFSRLVHEHAARALMLDPDYAWAHHLLGRWHREVSELTTTARLFVRLFYGGLPDASVTEARRHLQRAVELEPRQLQHQLELGFALLADHEPARARDAFHAGLAMPSRDKHDEPAKARARAALEQLPR